MAAMIARSFILNVEGPTKPSASIVNGGIQKQFCFLNIEKTSIKYLKSCTQWMLQCSAGWENKDKWRWNSKHFTSLTQFHYYKKKERDQQAHFWKSANSLLPLAFTLYLRGYFSGERLKGVRRSGGRKQSREKMYVMGRKLWKDGGIVKIKPLQKIVAIFHSPQSQPN